MRTKYRCDMMGHCSNITELKYAVLQKSRHARTQLLFAQVANEFVRTGKIFIFFRDLPGISGDLPDWSQYIRSLCILESK